MPFLAPRGAIRCDITTTLDEDTVAALAEEALLQSPLIRRVLGTVLDAWMLTEPPAGARSAFVRVRTKSEERTHGIKPGGFQDSVTESELGTVVALRTEPTDTGCVAQFWTSSTNVDPKSGRIAAAPGVRGRFRAFGRLVTKADPSADVSQIED